MKAFLHYGLTSCIAIEKSDAVLIHSSLCGTSFLFLETGLLLSCWRSEISDVNPDEAILETEEGRGQGSSFLVQKCSLHPPCSNPGSSLSTHSCSWCPQMQTLSGLASLRTKPLVFGWGTGSTWLRGLGGYLGSIFCLNGSAVHILLSAVLLSPSLQDTWNSCPQACPRCWAGG